tara:strand:- start:2085 stop:2696 length:612 start_codon:yes stop_codon:yes gene_type:complete
MKISIDTNGVLRDTFGKAEQVYQKFMIDDYIMGEDEEEFEFKLNTPITSMTLTDHFIFKEKEDIFDFFYTDFPMNIFGHASSTENNSFNTVNEIYRDLRGENDLMIVSDEIEKSKPATLFFLSKFGCLIEKIKFFSKITEASLWDETDILITSNPNLMDTKPEGKIVVKYKTTYNENSVSDYEIETIEEFKNLYETLKLKNND